MELRYALKLRSQAVIAIEQEKPLEIADNSMLGSDLAAWVDPGLRCSVLTREGTAAGITLFTQPCYQESTPNHVSASRDIACCSLQAVVPHKQK